MYCIKCGKQIKDNSSFCPYCGSGQSYQEEKRSPDFDMANTVKNKVNWYSVIFGPFHVAYRNMLKEWLRVLKEPLILELSGLILIIMLPESKEDQLGIALAAFLSGLIWRIIKQVLFGISFEQRYYEQSRLRMQKGTFKNNVSIGKVVLTILAYVLIWLLLSLVPEIPDTGSVAKTTTTQAGITEDGVFNMPDEQQEYEKEKAAEQEFAEYVKNHVIVCDGQSPISFFGYGQDQISQKTVEEKYGVYDEEKEDGLYYHQVYFNDLPGEFYIAYDENGLTDYVEWYGKCDDETQCIQVMQGIISYYQEVLGDYDKTTDESPYGYSISSTETVYSWYDYGIDVYVIKDKNCMGYRVSKSWED